eukprot:scaffold65752_cov58-Attheya_sp.AAC.3
MKCLRSLFWILSVWLVYGSGILVVVVVGEAGRQERSDPPPPHPQENEERFVSVTIEMDGSSNDTSRLTTHGISVALWGVIHFTLWAYNTVQKNDPKASCSRHGSDESFVFQQTLSHLCRTIHHEDEEKTNDMERNEKEDAMIQHDSTTKDRALFILRHACASVQQQQDPMIKRLDRIAARVDMDVTCFNPLGSRIRSGGGAHGTHATPVRYVAFPVRVPHPQHGVNIEPTNMGHDDDDDNNNNNNKTYYLQWIVPSFVLLRDENTSEMWKEQTNLERRMGQWYSGVPSPFHLAILNDDSSPPLLADQRRVQASISSSLSNQGGMHRPFHHKINLSVPNNDHSLKKPEDTVIRMDIALPLSEHVYIDMDDPYHDGGTSTTACRPSFIVPSSVVAGNNGIPTQPLWNVSCSIELILPPSSSSSSSSSIFETSVIDVEQPSFASPQHVVLFRLHMTMDATTAAATTATRPLLLSDPSSIATTHQIEIEFSNTLHIRYPSPVVLERDSEKRNPRWLLLSSPQESRHVMVHIPKPIILTGTTDGDDGKKQKTEVVVVYPERCTHSNILMLSVAAGADEDYWFVVTITLLSSLIGSIIMIRDISRVSIWI